MKKGNKFLKKNLLFMVAGTGTGTGTVTVTFQK
jgi:hypothetical protein